MEPRAAVQKQELVVYGVPLAMYIASMRRPNQKGVPIIDNFHAAFGTLLAERLDNNGVGVNPMGYIMATERLKHDCHTGTDSITGDTLPILLPNTSEKYSKEIDSQLDMIATGLARTVFGSDFAEQLQAIHHRESDQSAPGQSIVTAPHERVIPGPAVTTSVPTVLAK